MVGSWEGLSEEGRWESGLEDRAERGLSARNDQGTA